MLLTIFRPCFLSLFPFNLHQCALPLIKGKGLEKTTGRFVIHFQDLLFLLVARSARVRREHDKWLQNQQFSLMFHSL